MEQQGLLEAERATKRKRKPRGKGLRTRTGCQSCRARRVKCDETRPVCRACEKSSRECVYVGNEARPDDAGPSDGGQSSNVQSNPGDDASSVQYQDRTSSVQADVQQQDHLLPVDNALVQQQVPHHQQHAGLNVNDLGLSGLQSVAQTQHGFTTQPMFDNDLFETSPESNWSGWVNLSAEAASLGWFGLLANDATYSGSEPFTAPEVLLSPGLSRPTVEAAENYAQQYLASGPAPEGNESPNVYVSRDTVSLSDEELHLFEHFVTHLSSWIDVTDPDRYFAVIVPQMALKNRGLMSAILALAARHMSLKPTSASDMAALHNDQTSAAQYYHETLKYLQREMSSASFLRSDELLAIVLTISTYEMIDGSAKGWERHLTGVFWIQRSQLIHGESEGLKKRIWWAWLRQDIYAAFREKRKILSYYRLTRPCASLDKWELADRAMWLLGQCINYSSAREVTAGAVDVQGRLSTSTTLWTSLTEWYTCFEKYDRRLPVAAKETGLFQPIWVNPTQAGLAVQVHHLSKLLLLEHTPAIGGLKELTQRQGAVQIAVETICGIASCTKDDGASIVSTLCTFAAGSYVKEPARRRQVVEILKEHRKRTGWPPYDLSNELSRRWIDED